MILSKFNFYQQKNQHWIIYNSASSNCIVLPEAEYGKFLNETCSENEKQNYHVLGFYVDKNTDEVKKIVDNSKFYLSNFSKKKFRVLTTTCCNAKCPYCYEENVFPVTMTEDTANAVADFILSQSIGKKAIEIEWFGGEPLVNTSVIDIICAKILQNKADNVKFESSIVSNGYLIDENLVSKMIHTWNVYQIQITLDGRKEEYERVKGLGSDSFERVIHNIELLCNAKIHVVIRLNFNQYNVSELIQLIQYLDTLPFKNLLEVYPAKINNGKKEIHFLLENETIQMYSALHDYGFIRQLKLLPRTMKTPCAASHHGYYTINANGLLFKCDRKLLAGNSVGNVFFPENIDTKAEEKWESFILPDRCYECKLIPLCWGGCIYERIHQQDFCYITENIVNIRLQMLLDDYLKEISGENV